MPTLTAAEIIDYRELVGDECTEQVLSDARMQVLYDAATALGYSADRTQAVMVVYMLRRLLGESRKKIDNTNEMNGNREIRSQLFDHLMKMLEYWEGIAGLPGKGSGLITIGAMDMNLDYTEDDLADELSS